MSEGNPFEGIKVMIQRTDGRTHPAVIAKIHSVTRSVTVKWYEGGEIKGKEIDLDELRSMNTHIRNILFYDESEVSSNPLPNRLSKEGDEENENILTNQNSADSDNGNLKDQKHPRCKENSHMSSTRGSVPPKRGRPTAQLNQLSSANSHYESSKDTMNMDVVVPKSKRDENIPPSTPQLNIPSKIMPPPPLPPQDCAAGKFKKGSTVREVEKLKHNREARRQRQAEKKEEKEALMNMDPGNPNWELLAMIKEYQSQIEFKPLKESDPLENHQITVCVRKRPINKKEIVKKEVDVVTIPRKDQIIVHEPKTKVDLTKYLENQLFRFDYAFDETCSNEVVYKYTAKPLVETIFEGGMATCFAYGQTGSGKTHTMGGTFTGKLQDCKNGIYAMVARDVFRFLAVPKYKLLNLTVSSSFFEIYSGKVFDLLREKAQLKVLEDGKQQIQVVGLLEKEVNSVNEVLALIQSGNQARTSGQTSANSNSSRSHAIFQIILKNSGNNKVHGKFSLVDLAGNERGADTSSSNRLTRMEGAEINKSLLALKECIRALGRKGRVHLPFRASKLTQVLRDSFIGENSRTCMIAMISPSMSSCEHSLNTLRYADRVKELAATDPVLDTAMDTGEVCTESDGHDLAALISLSENEISADLLHFHEAVSQLQVLEEEVVDELNNWCQLNTTYTKEEHDLLAMTRVVDYDQEAFGTKLLSVINERISSMEPLRQKLLSFNGMLSAEEEMSKRMKN